MRLTYKIRRFVSEFCFVSPLTLALQGRQPTPRLSIPVPPRRSWQYALKPPKLSSLGWFTPSRSLNDFRRRLHKTFVATPVSGKKASEGISLLRDNHVKSQETENPGEQSKAHPGTPRTSWNASEPEMTSREASTTGSRPAHQQAEDGNRQSESEIISGVLAQATDMKATGDSPHGDGTLTMPTDVHDSLKLSLHGRDLSPGKVDDDPPSRSTDTVGVHRSSLTRATTAEELRGIALEETLSFRDNEIRDDAVARKYSPQSSIPANRPGNFAFSQSLPAVPLETMTTTVGSKKGISVAAAAAVLRGLMRGHRQHGRENEGLTPSLKQEDRTANPTMLASVAPLKDKVPGPAVRRFSGVVMIITFAAVYVNAGVSMMMAVVCQYCFGGLFSTTRHLLTQIDTLNFTI